MPTKANKKPQNPLVYGVSEVLSEPEMGDHCVSMFRNISYLIALFLDRQTPSAPLLPPILPTKCPPNNQRFDRSDNLNICFESSTVKQLSSGFRILLRVERSAVHMCTVIVCLREAIQIYSVLNLLDECIHVFLPLIDPDSDTVLLF